MSSAFLVSVGVVALGEIGDKTQLLAMVLAARYHRPLPICFGILIATLVNHAMAGAVGILLADMIHPDTLQWVLGVSFLLMAGWLLVPDKIDDDPKPLNGLGVVMTTIVMFFLAEMGDKTQIATVALAARYDSLIAVVAGSTVGMMLANVPAVYLGAKAAERLPLKLVHGLAALLFAALGIFTLLKVSGLVAG
ncbi:TMEM165/GDT1 family protein [Castellaniella caeni]|uniref:TMEM165/GDT1 family protein n=1 Tax=Castellaniella caeni TaxID=266123 RepID=UPI000829CC79|nr:TMEM165/GDT1 family protein [Castellaniella caeni]